MPSHNFRRLLWVSSFVIAFLFSFSSFSQSVTPASTLNNLCVGNAYTSLTNITITETSANDFASGSGTSGITFIISLSDPTKFQFEPSTGTVSVTNDFDVFGMSYAISSSSVTITYSD